MIPKVIHYCWFGKNKFPKLAEKCIKSWKKYCKGYKIIEWNEDNIDLSSMPEFVRNAYDNKKWAFVTDYVRLKVVYENGGIYVDTDVEFIKSPDGLLNYPAYFGMQKDLDVASGLGFGAEKGSPIVKEMMDIYENLNFDFEKGNLNDVMCPLINTEVCLKHGFVKNDIMQTLYDGTVILPTEYLCPKDFFSTELKVSENTLSIHHFGASWHSKNDKKNLKKIQRKIKRKKFFHAVGERFYGFTCKVLGKERAYKLKIKLSKLFRF